MVKIIQKITFMLNDELVSEDLSSGALVLDYVRERRHLTGTKQGCKEGDCGACTVILGELQDDGTVSYTPMTSCLMPMGELAGKHLVTIEGLNSAELSPVQREMVTCGGSQCGYCTPGFIVSMTAGMMEPRVPLNEDGLLYAISGNLCRCTGYRSIKEAGNRALSEVASHLQGSQGKSRIEGLIEAGMLPDYFNTVADRLKSIQPADSAAEGADSGVPSEGVEDASLFLAGGTDLYVQRGEEIPELPVDLLNRRMPRRPARVEDGCVVMAASMTFEDFAHDPVIRANVPDMHDYNLLISSWPVRTRASIAGNVCNGSPIADITCLLMALNAELHLSRQGRLRTVALKDFYLGYKKMNRADDEHVVAIAFPEVKVGERVNWEKVSKRAWLDIASVNAAARIGVTDGVFSSASLALGGVAATPLYLKAASAYLVGRPLSAKTVVDCVATAMDEFSPISDVRGSADYKALLARQLLLAHFEKQFADEIEMEEVYAAL
jgi:xanthine dehydrogenase small subunit